MTMRSSMTAIKRKLSTLANRCSRGTAQEKGSQRLTLTPDQESGEGGIRTPGTVSGTQQFQCCTIGHSVTSPDDLNRQVSIRGMRCSSRVGH